MSYYHSIYYSYQPVTRKAPETFESYTKVFMAWIEKWLNTIDAMFILFIFIFNQYNWCFKK
jgi:hypothetical protein